MLPRIPFPGASSAADVESLFRREDAFVDKSLTEGNALGEIDFKDGDGNTPDWSQPNQDRPIPEEMPAPFVAARVEQWNNLSWSYCCRTRQYSQ